MVSLINFNQQINGRNMATTSEEAAKVRMSINIAVDYLFLQVGKLGFEEAVESCAYVLPEIKKSLIRDIALEIFGDQA